MNSKVCNTCKTEKDISNFAFRNKAKGTTHNICKPCAKVRDAEYYQSSESRRKSIRTGVKARIKATREVFLNILENSSCVDCGESNPIVLEFDHLGDKKYNVSEVAGKTQSVKKLLEEIAKCEVRCANCHRVKTAKQRGWYKDRPYWYGK